MWLQTTVITSVCFLFLGLNWDQLLGPSDILHKSSQK